MMCICVVRLELDRSFVFAHGSGQINFAKEEHFAEREVRFREVGIKAESFEGRLFRLRRRNAPVGARIKGGQDIAGRNTGVSQRTIWIPRDPFLVEPDSFLNLSALP